MKKMTLKGGTTQACAVCKYQRRKCTSECLLAPYFPADQPKVFQNVHKLFGVSNILKLLKSLEPSQKKIAMDSIICHANIRDRYPVHGCWEEICRLRYQIWQVEEELHNVHQQLETYRQHMHQHHQGLSMADDVAAQLDLAMGSPCTNKALPLFNQTSHSAEVVPVLEQQYSYSKRHSLAYDSLYMDSKENMIAINGLWVEQPYANNNCCSSMEMEPQELVASQPVAIQQGVIADYDDDIHPFFDTIDDRQSYIYSKEASESSSEESLKDTRRYIENVAEIELKSAAACFSLTSAN